MKGTAYATCRKPQFLYQALKNPQCEFYYLIKLKVYGIFTLSRSISSLGFRISLTLAFKNARFRILLSPKDNSVRHLYLESVDLLPKLANKFDIGVLVDGGAVDDVLGAVGVAQRGQRFAVVHVRRAHRRNHNRLRVPAQTVLQQPRQHRVSGIKSSHSQENIDFPENKGS